MATYRLRPLTYALNILGCASLGFTAQALSVSGDLSLMTAYLIGMGASITYAIVYGIDLHVMQKREVP